MYLLVGLGNPGTKYFYNRHNIGHMVIDHVAKYHKMPNFKNKTKCSLSIGLIGSHKVILLKPTTFMNFSGESLIGIKSFYNIDTNNVFVFHDEIDLKLGEIKVKKGGGHNGHNGLKSIDKCIGPSYYRIRIGVDRPIVDRIQNKRDIVSKWVLTDFTEIEKKNIISKNLNLISTNLVNLICKEFECFNNNK